MPVIVLLDINMPTLSGWEVLNKIQQFNTQTIDLLSIYILSSSIDVDDHERATEIDMVLGYLEKPLSAAHIKQHFTTLNPE
ncbi:MAG: response regulator [Sphingobacteriales bacterium JAD_PAG50586_3]|nr:MAG: response regulator [Sphingobacteriales bacterium JAD_PAG50586_3]